LFLQQQIIGIDDTNSDDDDIEDYIGDGSQYKMVFVVNGELGMGIGKTAGQVAHASLGLYREIIAEQQRFGEMLLSWEQYGYIRMRSIHNKVHLFLTSAIFQSINSELKSLSIEALGGRRLSTSQQGLLNQLPTNAF